MMLLSFGFCPGRHGGSVNAIDVLPDDRPGSLLKDTLDWPFSALKVVRWETFVRGRSLALRNENMITRLLNDVESGYMLKEDGSKIT